VESSGIFAVNVRLPYATVCIGTMKSTQMFRAVMNLSPPVPTFSITKTC